MDLQFDMLSAHLEGVKGHPEQIMKDLGISYEMAIPISLGDAWWFWNCTNVPEKLPVYLEQMELK